MKICLVTAALPPYFAGAELRTYRFTQRLQARQDVQALQVGRDRWSETHQPPAQFPPHVHPIRLRFWKTASIDSPAGMARLGLHLAESFLRQALILWRLRRQFDLLHTVNPIDWFSLLPVPLARWLGKPAIVEMTLLGADDPLSLSRKSAKPTRPAPGRLPLKYRLFLQADAYISKSEALSQSYEQAGLDPKKLHQIGSGVDTQLFQPAAPEEKARLRQALGIEPEALLILFVGGVNRRKGVHLLLEAFQLLAATYPQARLVLAGPSQQFDQEYARRVHQQAAGMKASVRLVDGFVENVADWMRAADIFCLPSSREGLSMAILEAMACGLAVVASDIPEVALSQIENGVHGLLAPPENSGELAAALESLLRNAELRARLGLAARQRILDEFSLERIDQQVLDLYAKLLQKAVNP